MNNNQDIFDNNPQMNNINASNVVPPLSSNDMGMNQTQPLNVIPQSMPINNQDDTAHRFDQEFIKTTFSIPPQLVAPTQNTFINNDTDIDNSVNEPINNNMINNTINPQVNHTPIVNPISDITAPPIINDFEDESASSNQGTNKFINNNIETNNQLLNSLNVETEYNNIPKVDYSQEPQVQANLKKKNTITITSEGKVFIVIIIVLLLFIFVMPYLFDMIRNVKY